MERLADIVHGVNINTTEKFTSSADNRLLFVAHAEQT